MPAVLLESIYLMSAHYALNYAGLFDGSLATFDMGRSVSKITEFMEQYRNQY